MRYVSVRYSFQVSEVVRLMQLLVSAYEGLVLSFDGVSRLSRAVYDGGAAVIGSGCRSPIVHAVSKAKRL